MIGYIFNIQKFCLHDGPGIRTTVFFKGCNLRCGWCANPESQSANVQFTLDGDKCLGCGRCVSICPTGARAMENGRPALDARACDACGLCVEACPQRAIGREGRAVTVGEVLEEVMKDEAFYRRSGGGVTLSGGDPLLQRDFAAALARALHDRGVNVAIETAAAVESASFREFLKEVDFVHIDLKHFDCESHIRGTGVGNGQIIENIRAVKESGLDFLVRIPVIPGFNDGLEDARGFARLLASMEIDRVQLLPFHQMGERKYGLLGREYAFNGIPQLHREDLREHLKIFEQHGVHAKV